MVPVIEIVNRSTDQPYGVTRYHIHHTTELTLDDIIEGRVGSVPKSVIDYVLSTLVTTKY